MPVPLIRVILVAMPGQSRHLLLSLKYNTMQIYYEPVSKIESETRVQPGESLRETFDFLRL